MVHLLIHPEGALAEEGQGLVTAVPDTCACIWLTVRCPRMSVVSTLPALLFPGRGIQGTLRARAPISEVCGERMDKAGCGGTLSPRWGLHAGLSCGLSLPVKCSPTEEDVYLPFQAKCTPLLTILFIVQVLANSKERSVPGFPRTPGLPEPSCSQGAPTSQSTWLFVVSQPLGTPGNQVWMMSLSPSPTWYALALGLVWFSLSHLCSAK